MRPTQHPSNNGVLRPPQGASNEECRPLPITHVFYNNVGPGVLSYWQPTAQELALLNEGKLLRFSAMGWTHPPVAIGVDGDGLI